jgi:hypothetical protein
VEELSSLDNFKDIADKILSDIKVSDELKGKTLTRCEKPMKFKGRFIIPTAVAAALMVAVLNPSLGILEKGKRTENLATMMEATGGSGDLTTTKQGKATITDNPDASVSSDGTTVKTMGGNASAGVAQSSEPYKGSGKIIYRPGTIEEAKGYLGAAFKNPEYIPTGFKQSLVQVPVEMDKEGMDIMFGFEKDNSLFTIILRKGASSLDHFVGTKEADINGVKAQLTSGKLMAGSAEVAPHFTQMRWLSDNTLYIIEGQISEEEAVKVAKSIK